WDGAMVMRNNDGGAEMSTPVTEPLRTLTAAGHQSVVRWDHLVYGYDAGELRPVAATLPTQTTVQGDALLGPEVAIDDCTFRMLEPHRDPGRDGVHADVRGPRKQAGARPPAGQRCYPARGPRPHLRRGRSPHRRGGGLMRPYYADDTVTLWHGDCRDLVPALGLTA